MDSLPIRKVVLYKHGVGHFERRGVVDGDADLALHFRASEMNDVLKSLTLLDLGDGYFSSVRYESTRPLEQQLADLSLTLPERTAVTGLLEQLKGARIALDVGGERFEGVVMGLERVVRVAGAMRVRTHALAVLVDGGTVRSFDLEHVTSFTLHDPGLRDDLQQLLDALITGKKKDRKGLTVVARGAGPREIVLSYAIEAPVWKTSYRILLGGEAPLLQAWALVDNTHDEDWNDVALTLVAGLPISFVHDLYAARYKRRPVVRVRDEAAYAPPEIESPIASFEAPAACEEDTLLDTVEVDPGADGAERAVSGGRGAAMSAPRTRRAASTESVQIHTRTAEVGDLFHYEIAHPVSVRRGQSALVPILQSAFEGRRVAVYNPTIRAGNPMSAVLFRNTTGSTLEGGPVTVLEDGGYVGEAMLALLRPGEERLVPFSVELGCVVRVDPRSERLDVRAARIHGGTLELRRYELRRTCYAIENRTDRALDLFLEHPFLRGWELTDTQPPVETTENFQRFRLTIPPRTLLPFVVSERHDLLECHAVSSVASDTVALWLEARYIDAATRKVLDGLARIHSRIVALTTEIAQYERERAGIERGQDRVRKNLAALGTGPGEKSLRDRYVTGLGQDEDRLKSIANSISQLQDQRARLEKELAEKAAAVSFETTL